MATGQGILDRLKKAKENRTDESKPGVLPLVAYYGKEPEVEEQRTRMYNTIRRVMAGDVNAGRPSSNEQVIQGDKFVLLRMESAVAVVNTTASPIEFLVSTGEMENGRDLEGMGRVRFHTAIRLRDLVHGAQVNGIKSQSFSGMPGGSGGLPIDVRGYQLDCWKILSRVRKDMPEPWMFKMLEAVVIMDEWMNLRPLPKRMMTNNKRKARLKTIRDLHYALDRVGRALGYIAQEDFTQRWGRKLLYVPPPVRRHTPASTAEGQPE